MFVFCKELNRKGKKTQIMIQFSFFFFFFFFSSSFPPFLMLHRESEEEEKAGGGGGGARLFEHIVTQLSLFFF